MKIRTGAVLAILATVLAVAGCGGSGDEMLAPTVNVTGTWRVVPDSGITSVATLHQNGASVQGTEPDGYVWAGSVNGDQLSATVTVTDGSQIALTATVSGNAMAGSYETSSGAKGTFTATRG